MEERLLEVKNLKVSFNVGKKKLTAVENVEFSLDKGKVIGIVGESGCGKSVTATSILRLVPPAVSIIDEDSQILFDGEDLVKAPEARMREIRGNEISMIFQEPMSSLNPVYRIGDQMLEMIRTHNKQISKKGCAGPVCGDAEEGGDPVSGTEDQGISPSAFGRDAAACDDRHGIALQPQAADRR